MKERLGLPGKMPENSKCTGVTGPRRVKLSDKLLRGMLCG